MGTNNTIFGYAHRAPMIDQSVRYTPEIKSAMQWPEWINSDYDLKNHFGVYERLFQFTVISLCSDIEYFFKDLYARENLTPGKGKGYFQRFTEVINDLKKIGAPLDEHQNDLNNLTLAFAIRHVAIHNFGYADEDFVKATRTELRIGEHVPVNQEIYLKCSDSYREFLRCMDRWLTLRSTQAARGAAQ